MSELLSNVAYITLGLSVLIVTVILGNKFFDWVEGKHLDKEKKTQHRKFWLG